MDEGIADGGGGVRGRVVRGENHGRRERLYILVSLILFFSYFLNKRPHIFWTEFYELWSQSWLQASSSHLTHLLLSD